MIPKSCLQKKLDLIWWITVVLWNNCCDCGLKSKNWHRDRSEIRLLLGPIQKSFSQHIPWTRRHATLQEALSAQPSPLGLSVMIELKSVKSRISDAALMFVCVCDKAWDEGGGMDGACLPLHSAHPSAMILWPRVTSSDARDVVHRYLFA